ncbi:MAG: molybdopterin oxidoreductase family protein [Syntrophobacteraceae bacterium]
MLEHDPLKRFAGTYKPYDESVRTVCRQCTVGCGLLAYLKDGKIVDIQGDENDRVGRGRLCARGIAFHQCLDHPERIGSLLRRDSVNEPFQSENDWDKSLDMLAERLRKVRARCGPGSLAIGCDPEAGLDFFIGAMRFGRLWGTAEVYHPLYATRGISTGPKPVLPSAPRCTDWGKSACILLVEADLATTHSVAFGHLLDAREKGAEIIALDSRFTPTMSKADVTHLIRPESGNRFGMALMKALLEEDPHALESAQTRFDRFDKWKAAFESLAYEELETMTGLGADKVKEVARHLAAKGPVTVITGKRPSGRQNSDIWRTVAQACNRDVMQGGGWYPLDGGLPPFRPFSDIDEAAEVPLGPENPVKALISSGNWFYDHMPSMREVAKDAELAIHFGAFANETMNLAHVVIPATLWPEREAPVFTNDREIRWANRILEPAPHHRTGLDFWTSLAQRMADDLHGEWKTYFPWKTDDGVADPRAFYGWLLDQSPYTAGCGIERIIENDGQRPFFWPVDPAAFATGPGKIEAFVPPPELVPLFKPEDRELFPLICQTTRIISRSGNADNFRALTRELEDAEAVHIHPETARALGIETGDRVLIHAPGETIEASAWLTRMVPRSLIWSARRLGSNLAVICKKGRPREEAHRILKEFLR